MATLRQFFMNALNGDAAARSQIVDVIRQLARAVCRGGGPGGAAVDWKDVAQEASRRFFTVGLRRRTKRGSERSYLYTMVRSTVLQIVRSEARRRRREESAGEEVAGQNHDPEAGFDVRAILAAISEDCGHLLKSVFLQGTTYAELAGDLDIPESSLRVEVGRCLREARDVAGRRAAG